MANIPTAKLCGIPRVLFAAVAVAAVFVSGAESAGLYACKDKDGRTQYVTEPKGNCESRSANAPAPNKPSAKSKPAPRAASKEQRLRDKKRGRILLYELQEERKFYNHYKSALASANGGDRDVLSRRAHRHRQNILALRQELARLGLNAGNTGD